MVVFATLEDVSFVIIVSHPSHVHITVLFDMGHSALPAASPQVSWTQLEPMSEMFNIKLVTLSGQV